MITGTKQESWIAPPPAYAFDESRGGAEQAMREYFSLYADGQNETWLAEASDVVSGRAIGDPTDYMHTHVLPTGDHEFYIVVSKPRHSELAAYFTFVPDIWCGSTYPLRGVDRDPFVGPFSDLGSDLKALSAMADTAADDDDVPNPDALARATSLAKALVKQIREWSAPGSILRTYACVADEGSIDLFFESSARKVLINVTPDPLETNYAVLDKNGKSSSAMMTDLLAPIAAFMR